MIKIPTGLKTNVIKCSLTLISSVTNKVDLAGRRGKMKRQVFFRQSFFGISIALVLIMNGSSRGR